MSDPLRARIGYLCLGNSRSPRARVVRVTSADGSTKDVAIAPSARARELVDTILSLSPTRLEAYEDDPPKRLVRAFDLPPEEEEQDDELGTHDADLMRRIETIFDRHLSHFADLIAAAYKDANAQMGLAFKRVVQIAEYNASRASAAERTADNLQSALAKQTQALIRSQLAAAAAGDEDAKGGLEGLLMQMIGGFQQGQAAKAAAHATNGVAGKDHVE